MRVGLTACGGGGEGGDKTVGRASDPKARCNTDVFRLC